MEAFSKDKWEKFAIETLEYDGAPTDIAAPFALAMERVYEAEGEFDSVLWTSINPCGTEDRTWVRVFAHLTDRRHYNGILTGLDGAHAQRIKAAFDRNP